MDAEEEDEEDGKKIFTSPSFANKKSEKVYFFFTFI